MRMQVKRGGGEDHRTLAIIKGSFPLAGKVGCIESGSSCQTERRRTGRNACIHVGVYKPYTECAATDIPQTRRQRQERRVVPPSICLAFPQSQSYIQPIYLYIPKHLGDTFNALSLDSCYSSIEYSLHQFIHQVHGLHICFHHPDLKGREHWNIRENSRHQYRHYITMVWQVEVVVMGIIMMD